MKEDKNFDIEAWLQKANHDLVAADRLIFIQPAILDYACFHCQQAIENFLKAYLISQEQHIEKIHNIDFLLSECLKFNPEFEQIEVKDVSVYAVIIRYPYNFINPEMEEVREYYAIAVQSKGLVEKLITE